MKKKRVLSVLLAICFIFSCFVISYPGIIVSAADTDTSVTTTEEGVRSEAEIKELKSIYKELFPDEYHYIEEYERNGVNVNMDVEEIETIFYGEKELGDTTYELWALNNGQVFTNVIENVAGASTWATSSTKTQSFNVGDLGYYLKFTVTYTINSNSYDKITSAPEPTGSGFLITPFRRRTSFTETSSTPAYVMYVNAEIQNGTGILYDLGVAVGNNKAKATWQIAQGLDAWLMYALSIIWMPG